MAADKVSGKSAEEIQAAFTINMEKDGITTFEDFAKWYVYRWSSWVKTGENDTNITNMGRDGLTSYLEDTYDTPIMLASIEDKNMISKGHIAAHFGNVLLHNACVVLKSPVPYKESSILQSADGSLKGDVFTGTIVFTNTSNFDQTNLPQNLTLLPDDAQTGVNRTYTVKLAGNVLQDGAMKLTQEDATSVDNS